MSSLRSRVSLLLLLILAVVVSIYSLRGFWSGDAAPAKPATASAAPQPTDSAGPPVVAPPSTDGVTRAPPVATIAPSPLGQRFRAATDYLDFVRSIHEVAKAGDAEAQYYLFRALDYCSGMFRTYFGRPGKSRTLDEGLRWAARGAPALDVDEARLVNDRCRALEESDSSVFGEREQWLQKAAVGGQPNAQVKLAGKFLMGTSGIPEDEAERSRQDAREMVRAALASRDPEVIAETGNLLALRRGIPEQGFDNLAWIMAACARGYDCSPASDLMKSLCRFDTNCQPYETLNDMIRRHVDDYPSLEARSGEVNRLIDAGDWAGLGFAEQDPARPNP